LQWKQVDHMPLGKGIVELFEAIPGRIEVDGHEPTWRVTGGSFESVLAFAQEAYDEPVVIARQDRSRWWPRVTLTVTTDPELAAGAPDLDTFATPSPAEPEPDRSADASPAEEWTEPSASGRHAAVFPEQRDDRAQDSTGEGSSTLEEIFAAQESSRRKRLGIPEQRSR
jgi:hypothetical protein